MAEKNASDASDDSDSLIDENEIALQGMMMLVNNQYKEAHELFYKYRDYSPLMHGSSSTVTFLQALLTFEEDKLAQAMKALQETEKKCESSDSFLNSMQKKLKRKSFPKEVNLEDKYQRQIILGDAILNQAVLTFTNQDIPSYIKGGWLLRKAYKTYEKAYRDLRRMYLIYHEHMDPDTGHIIPKIQSMPQIAHQASMDSAADASVVEEVAKEVTPDASGDGVSNGPSKISNEESGDIQKLPSETTSLVGKEGKKSDSKAKKCDLTYEVVEKLLGSVSVGYGSFQLCISLVPPKVLKLIELLGFDGDREVGLTCLDFASRSSSVKAPMATLGLLWYHSVIRPFFALDGPQVSAGFGEAREIMERNEKDYPDSALFRFFKGRILRLEGKIDEALSEYRAACESSNGQREIELMFYHEIGWCSLMKMDWQAALDCFIKLKQDSRWSKSYYAYLSGLCNGALGNMKESKELFKEVPKLMKRKNNQLEIFVVHRAKKFDKQLPGQDHAVLLLLEVLYLWNAIPQCASDDLKLMLEECNKLEEKRAFHMRCMIEGSIYREQSNKEMATQCFEEAVARHQGMKEDHHVAAFALYELGTIMVENSETFDEGRKNLEKAKSMKDYDFENRLNVRIHAALKKAKAEGTPV